MAGWNLKDGCMINEELTELQIWEAIGKFLSKKTIMKNLYKICLLRSLIEESREILDEKNIFQDVVIKFAELYWNKKNMEINMTVYNGISKISKQEENINRLKDKYNIERFITFSDLNSIIKSEYIKLTKEVIKTNVIGAIFSDFSSEIYSFNLKKEVLILNRFYESFFRKNRLVLLQFLEYREVEFLKMTEKKEVLRNNYADKNLDLDIIINDYYKLIKDEIEKMIKGVK